MDDEHADAAAATFRGLTADEIAAALGVSRFSIYCWGVAGRIPSVRLGRKVRFELAAVVGRAIAVRPKTRDEWEVVPNLWGGVVGRPGVMKIPTLHAALDPLHRIAHQAAEGHRRAVEQVAADAALREARIRMARAEALRGDCCEITASPPEGTDKTDKGGVLSVLSVPAGQGGARTEQEVRSHDGYGFDHQT